MKKAPINSHQIYWHKIIQKIEYDTYKEQKDEFIRIMDYSTALPVELYKRIQEMAPGVLEDDDDINLMERELSHSSVDNIMISDFDDDDLSVGGGDTVHERQRKEERKIMAAMIRQQKDLKFSESKCSLIERLEAEFPYYSVCIDKPLDLKRNLKKKKEFNWLSEYICKTRKERIAWKSLLYPSSTLFSSKTIEEQADYIMDVGSKRFTDWINSLSTNRANDMNPKLVKSLFSIEPEQSLYNSLKTNPIQVNAIAGQLAETWHVPEMALETKYDRKIKYRWQHKPKKIIRHAFGRTIREKDLPWVPKYSEKPIETYFPEELLSGELLFKGIGHLSSTKKFVDFCRRNELLRRPEFLVKCGYFKNKGQQSAAVGQPLYDRLNLKY